MNGLDFLFSQNSKKKRCTASSRVVIQSPVFISSLKATYVFFFFFFFFFFSFFIGVLLNIHQDLPVLKEDVWRMAVDLCLDRQ